jgi:hypothetical protein
MQHDQSVLLHPQVLQDMPDMGLDSSYGFLPGSTTDLVGIMPDYNSTCDWISNYDFMTATQYSCYSHHPGSACGAAVRQSRCLIGGKPAWEERFGCAETRGCKRPRAAGILHRVGYTSHIKLRMGYSYAATVWPTDAERAVVGSTEPGLGTSADASPGLDAAVGVTSEASSSPRPSPATNTYTKPDTATSAGW